MAPDVHLQAVGDLLVAVSTIPAFKAALFAALGSRPALAGVQLAYGAPYPNPGREFISLADVDGAQVAEVLGRLKRREDHTLTCHVMVIREGTNQQAATERAFTIAGEIEDCLRADPTLDATYAGEGQIIWSQITGPLSLEERANDANRAAIVTMSVGWAARI